MKQQIINRYKRLRTEQYLCRTYRNDYAFVGMGQHALTNLYPVLHHLGVPLKYICVRSERKARLIGNRFPGVTATTSLATILVDERVKGVFVAASPAAHFTIASQILASGKSLFVEKPPCRTAEELEMLIRLRRLHGSPAAIVGLQKRFAPAVRLLEKRMSTRKPVSYDLHYLTGVYPEGSALLDLYIHPIDLVCHLFGKPTVIACQETSKNSFLLMLRHPDAAGTLELSTAYSWTSAEESLKVVTSDAVYRLSQMDELTCERLPVTALGIPTEKVFSHHKTLEYLYSRNNFVPTLPDNQIVSQGYYDEIVTFVNAVEATSPSCMLRYHRNQHPNQHPTGAGSRPPSVSDLESLRDVYGILERLRVRELSSEKSLT